MRTKSLGSLGRFQKAEGASRLDVLVMLTLGLILGVLLTVGWSSAREGGGLGECFSNQRQLMQAMFRYSLEHEDEIVPAVGNPGGGFWPLIENVTPGISGLEAKGKMLTNFRQSPLYPYLLNAGVFHCPADRRAQRLLPGQGWAYDSYSKVNPMNGMGWQGSSAEIGPQPHFTRTHEIRDPTETLAFLEEADPRGRNFGTWVMNVLPASSWVDVVGMFHQESTVFSFADGRVERKEWRDRMLIQAGNDALSGKSNFYLLGGNTENPDFRWLHDRYRHKRWTPIRSR